MEVIIGENEDTQRSYRETDWAFFNPEWWQNSIVSFQDKFVNSKWIYYIGDLLHNLYKPIVRMFEGMGETLDEFFDDVRRWIGHNEIEEILGP